ncbi:bifunctional DNA primase/polymerase [Streptomyces neyagawaensis]|uniref:bifunctional DNA primase/polymerase n=1 Tax=Streptomyces neyagawaensis TaxID=42238 RepID=UPI0006E38EFF|nr:bifunctional DNA primase/polymerase [Streptomyces neyagawaensis]MCL6738016.1 bifunctional DNA primase/polymerase [Streptomyces neyagawaensis]MDE1688321.1 bifunctional DNA primase/polymerase [Streptomyces neyagawaensis]
MFELAERKSSARTPYRDGVVAYAESGWHGIIPVKRSEKTPYEGLTGEKGIQRTPEEAVKVAFDCRAANIALRMGRDMVAIDIDDYDGKNGAATLAQLEAKWGELPPTVYSTARGPGTSGIRLYRRRSEGKCRTKFEPGIEIAQWHHRFVMCWPSIHPGTRDMYQWYEADGSLLDGVPDPDNIPYLPERWEKGLQQKERKAAPTGPIETLEKPPAGLVAAIQTVAEQIASLPVDSGADGPVGIAALKLTSYIPHAVSADYVRAQLQAAVDKWEKGHDAGYEAIESALAKVGTGKHQPKNWTDTDGAGFQLIVSTTKKLRRLRVETPDDAYRWLCKSIGIGPLSGFMLRGGMLVYCPRLGDEGYVPPKDEKNSDGPAQVRRVDVNNIRGTIQRTHWVYKESKSKDGDPIVTNIVFPAVSCELLFGDLDAAENLRNMRAVTHTPIARPDGSILDEPGYDHDTGYLYIPHPGMDVPPIPKNPTIADIQNARELLEYWVCGFPFVTEDDRVNFLGLAITPVIREMVDSAFKFGVFTAPASRTGKSLLAQQLRNLHGGICRAATPKNGEEWNKSISSILSSTTGPVVTWDNVKGTIKSPELDSVLTNKEFALRGVGQGTEVVVPNDRIWTMTSNNANLGGDLVQRAIWIKLDAKTSRPENRIGFKIKNLDQWTRDNRGPLVAAMLTLVRAWVHAGRERDELGDVYGYWRGTVRGILKVAGFKGTFDLDESKGQDVSDESQAAGALISNVWDVFKSEYWTARDLLQKVPTYALDGQRLDKDAQYIDGDLLPEKVAIAKSDVSQGIQMGNWLRERIGTPFGDMHIEKGGMRGGKQLWRIVKDNKENN